MATNPSGAVYGTIAVAALLAAESARRETYLGTVSAVVVTLVLYWFAHSYASYAEERLEGGERLTVAGLGRTMAHELTILIGAAIPLIPLLGWWVTGGGLTNAVTAAVWTSAAIIVITEVALGLRAQLSGRGLIGQAGMGALLGLMVIALKILLH
jgi:hypothetical protein